VRALAPDLMAELSARIWDARACTVLLLGGAKVAASHRRLLARAQALGHALTDDPGLTAFADGAALVLANSAPGVWRGTLPAATATLRLISRSIVPAELDPGVDDRRRLGVAIGGLWLGGRKIALRGAGIHAPEPDWRWTDGDATLVLRPRARPVPLKLRLKAGWQRYWATAAAAAEVASPDRRTRDAMPAATRP
jgi:hypothetical protein